jgi:hypothetical protein
MPIDMHALTSLAREAVGSAVVQRSSGRESAELGALCRAIGYVLGGSYNTPEWSGLVNFVRAIVADGAPREDSSGAIAVASHMVTGAFLTLVSRDNAAPYTRTTVHHAMHIRREADGCIVLPSDEDWLMACGYLRWSEMGTLAV